MAGVLVMFIASYKYITHTRRGGSHKCQRQRSLNPNMAASIGSAIYDRLFIYMYLTHSYMSNMQKLEKLTFSSNF